MTPTLAPATDADAVELAIARLLLAGTVAGVVLLSIGVILMLAAGMDPLAAEFPAFDPATILPDMAALRADGFLWAGLVILISTPIARTVGELVMFTARRDRVMALVSAAILGVIVMSVVIARLVEG